MFLRAATHGLLEPLAPWGMHQWLSIYADDVMVFLKLKEVELQCCAEILESFGMASGLRVNFRKSAAMPIQCSTA